MSGGNIKVVVRCRPLNSRELARGAKGLIRMEGTQTILEPPEDVSVSAKAHGKKPQVFSFDKSYWSAGPRNEPGYASQQTLYEDLGVELLDHSFEGFNTCIFAYGQTGSGKSYSMMGYGADKGIIPLTTSELFGRVESRTASDPNLSYTVEVSYIEIYNEKVRDLLNPKNKGNLRVREHPSLGPYVEDLSRLVVENYSQMMTLMDEGNKARTVASTNMNETSSRSHAVFTLILTQKRLDQQTNMTGEKVSKISLVDLAGSERQASTGATGTRLREGANINKSLTTLGKVIAALAQASNAKTKKKDEHIPYRDSVLTWLLKESLGGNSKTAMIAAISPADYEETLSTLRYADAAKKIKTHAVVNEDPNAKLIRELKEELELLRSRVAGGGGLEESTFDPTVPPEKQIVTYRTKEGEIRKVTKLELQDQLQASEKLMDSLNQTWEEKMATTQAIHQEREKALEEMGISIDKNVVGVHAPQKHPSLVNLNEDPLMSECLVYQLKPGTTTAGSLDGGKAQIRLSGSHILAEHCVFTNIDGIVSIEAMPDARTFVNGKRVPPQSPVKLLSGFRVILGDFHVFRFNDPAAVRAQRIKLRESASLGNLSGEASPGFRSDSPNGKAEGELMDWSAARREVADIEKLGDHDLDRLFDDIMKVRTQRGRPDSRIDLAAELESRLMTRSVTEESLNDVSNPWAGAQGTTMTSYSAHTPGPPEHDKNIVDERSEADTELPIVTGSAARLSAVQAADTALEQEHLAKQLREMAQQVRIARSQAAVANALEPMVVEAADWSARELRLVACAIAKWKRLRAFTMAEQILKGAVEVREANVIAHEMGKRISYNLLVVRAGSAGSVSSLDGINGVVEFEDVSNSVGSALGPSVMVKVLDRESKSVYLWNWTRFRQQLTKIRHIMSLKERPSYTLHFRIDDSFAEVPPPKLSTIGASRVPLRLLALQIPYVATIPITCPYTMEALGSCQVSFNMVQASNFGSGVATPESAHRLLGEPLEVGGRFTFTVHVDKVRGLTSADYTLVHAQTRLSSLVGPSIEADDTFASLPVDLTKSSVSHLSLRKTITIIVTDDILSYLHDGYANVDFFANVRPEFLSKLERWDRNREISPPSSGTGTPARSGELRPTMRRCETDFVMEEHHDVLAILEIRELSSNGDYVPAEVVDGVFQLHQGLQRRIGISLKHSSGRSLPWQKLSHVSTSDIRIVAKGQPSSVSKPEVELRLSSQRVEFHADGTTTLTAAGFWDSASHYSPHLDKRTPSDQHVLVRLLWAVEVESLDEPAIMCFDLPLRVIGRDAKRSSLLSVFSTSKIYHKVTAMYAVNLTPPLVRSTQDLWRLDTSKKHVRGEEGLGDWKPRSLSLLEDFARLGRTEIALADVQTTKAVLELMGDVPPTQSSDDEREELLGRCIKYWHQAMQHRIRHDFSRETAEQAAVAKKFRKMIPDLEPKLIPTVKQVALTHTVTKQGTMMLLRDSQANQWEKLHFVLRRPYLCIHGGPNEREKQIINLSHGHVAQSPDVEMLLGHRFAFTIFTPTNSYILRTVNQKEMDEWMSVISASCDV